MDPQEILLLLGGAVGTVAVLGAGGWALLRGRKDDQGRHQKPDDTADTASRGTTATKERPAAPTWGDTLSGTGSATAPPPTETPSRPAAPDTDDVPEAADVEAPADQDLEPRDTAAPTTEGSAPVEAPADDTPAEVVEVEAPAEEDARPDATSTAPPVETPEPAADRMVRLRERLARSGSIGRGLLGLLSRETVDADTWDEIEETLLLADLGPDATDELMDGLRERMRVLGDNDPVAVREVLREELVKLVDPTLDRRLAASRHTAEDGTEVPSALLMVGVNGTGKTTTVGKLARVLVAEGRTVVLGAADTFRAAAADQLATWGSRVGVDTVRSDIDGADPAAVAFDAARTGIEQGVDVVIIDTAGRLQNKKGLMDELGKVRRVTEKALHGVGVKEVLLVLDATTGQNGMQQARVFSEAVDVTGIVLTKLDGTAKGGIVVNVQRELGVPVKMVGLGEGMDDLAPFDAYGFVDALLGD
ncbi:MAG: signal recognition particle-docking protein FtsY [Brachybacterium sp.]|nr:signal recognition particle-docking protein FtsY [Brachybacterium sp.]